MSVLYFLFDSWVARGCYGGAYMFRPCCHGGYLHIHECLYFLWSAVWNTRIRCSFAYSRFLGSAQNFYSLRLRFHSDDTAEFLCSHKPLNLGHKNQRFSIAVVASWLELCMHGTHPSKPMLSSLSYPPAACVRQLISISPSSWLNLCNLHGKWSKKFNLA